MTNRWHVARAGDVLLAGAGDHIEDPWILLPEADGLVNRLAVTT